jgi:hypothetical protein
VRLIVTVLVLIFVVEGRAFSQDRPATPNPCDAASAKTENSKSSQAQAPEKKKDQERIFGIFPAFNVSDQVDLYR